MGTPLEMMITTLPTKGTLYQVLLATPVPKRCTGALHRSAPHACCHLCVPSSDSTECLYALARTRLHALCLSARCLSQTDDGTLTGNRTKIDKHYNNFDVGTTFPQYASRVLRVSSFWGNPPQADYHPMTILGPPDCATYGECPQEQAWVSDMSVYPPIGQLLLHSGLVAYVVAASPADATLSIEYGKQFKPDPAQPADAPWRQCIINPAGSHQYPGDCSFDFAGYTINAETMRVSATVPRTSVEGLLSGGWSPLNQEYIGDANMTGGGAFGEEYRFDHNQKDTYSGGAVPYTEFIEIAIEEPVFPVLVEVGSSRGMGHIVNIKARPHVGDGDEEAAGGEWTSIYSGTALLEDQATAARTREYWRWTPSGACRPHHQTSVFRIEVDTSSATGINDWNYIDYVRVYGASLLQPAALPSGHTKVVYVPHEHANGDDHFSYAASDCPGNIFRFSASSGEVDISIAAVNDPPYAIDRHIKVTSYESANVNLAFGDDDVDDTLGDNLTITLTQMPAASTFSVYMSADDYGSQTDLQKVNSVPFQMPASAQGRVHVVAGGEVGNETFAFTVRDASGEEAAAVVTILVQPQPASFAPLISAMSILGAISIIAATFALYKFVGFIQSAVKAKKMHEKEREARCRKAFTAAMTQCHACHLISLENLRALGRLMPHEYARDRGLLVTMDNFEDLITFSNENPTAFISQCVALGASTPWPRASGWLCRRVAA